MATDHGGDDLKARSAFKPIAAVIGGLYLFTYRTDAYAAIGPNARSGLWAAFNFFFFKNGRM